MYKHYVRNMFLNFNCLNVPKYYGTGWSWSYTFVYSNHLSSRRVNMFHIFQSIETERDQTNPTETKLPQEET